MLATFGRGFYVLDDFTPLRNYSKDMLEKPGYIFPVKEAKMFVENDEFDNQGSMYYVAKNPPLGATIKLIMLILYRRQIRTSGKMRRRSCLRKEKTYRSLRPGNSALKRGSSSLT